ncbi:YjbF family lipoprotein [Mixta tenebrionis]|mgnify:CR=1 FL=1|uniref:YjbF family lipoprotein n=1 Tax=Mixta tenebrionis TaxID=2562439 RepID=A0A506V628_9GAMM|nr:MULTISPECIES: YjbF family lipoprotein [Mixta]QHM77868.1 putative lipoprotein GfcB [Mixta theicola]TPW40790.1 YjbF family lipoprotein [Mixta tenebrionis]
MRHILLLFFCLLLQACTPAQQGLMESVKQAFAGLDDVTVPVERIQSLPYASIYLRVNQGQRLFLVLGYAENGQHKWITQDRAMLVTQNGRLIKTLGLSDNLLEVTNLTQDPLARPLLIQEGDGWTRVLSWTTKNRLRSALATSRFQRGEDQVLHIAGRDIACRVWHEKVSVAASGARWQNTFWIDSASGEVRQSVQNPGAGALTVDITLLKPVIS